jgi:hypothetical protein
MLRYASVFIKNCPKQAIHALKTNSFKKIDIPKLIPAFINLKMPGQEIDFTGKAEQNPERQKKLEALDDALKYVTEHCIKTMSSKEKTVHNLAIYFYAEREKPDEMLDFL